MRELAELGYISEPHAAIAYRALRDQLQEGEFGLFLGTAHPAKFKESVEAILGGNCRCRKRWRCGPICRCCRTRCRPALPSCANS